MKLCDRSTCSINAHFQLQETGVGAVAKPVPVVEVAHSTKNRRKQKPKLYQEETGHSKVGRIQWQSIRSIRTWLRTILD